MTEAHHLVSQHAQRRVGRTSTCRPSDLSAGSTQGRQPQPTCRTPHLFPRSAASGATRSTNIVTELAFAHQPTTSLISKIPKMARDGAPPAELRRGPGRKRKYATDADRRRAYALARRVKDEKDGRVFLRSYEPREWRVKSPSPECSLPPREQIIWTPVHPNYMSPLLWRWRDRSDGCRAYLYDATRCLVTVRATRHQSRIRLWP